MDEKLKILHGTIEATIFNASPYSSLFPFNCLFKNKGKPNYVTIKINNKKVAKTSEEKDRIWNQTFQIQCAHPIDSTLITITLKSSTSTLGKFFIKAQELLNNEGNLINGFFPLLMEEHGKPNPNLKLKFMLWFKPIDNDELESPSWRNLVLRNGEFEGLNDSSFPQRSNCNVKLYHDAHHSSHFHQPYNNLCGDSRKLFEDLYKAIEGAKYIIYIAAWSLNPKMILVRDPQTEIPHARGINLGELLKKKAEEGVAVRIMIWDDETSLPFIKNKGEIINTNDDHHEDAYSYFNNTKVICRKCPRLHHKFPTLFSHHQKTITIDTLAHNNNDDERELMSFLGGFDLCEGRYDTEQHSLFQTLIRESHCYDFYQTSILRATLNRGGPRLPWHDSHACVKGEASWDILANFEQRWKKQCDPSFLIPSKTLLDLVPRTSSTNYHNSKDDNNNNWKVQVFRSIDHSSADFLSQSLRKLSVERTIHEAYVDAIRCAEKFIYIENQYFIGGCQLWKKNNDCGCTNLIPIEIALKIVSKIRAKERFSVYIIIPMWPKGDSQSESVQDILYWTRETMAMMYKLIGDALKENGGKGHPKDYLNFFCLANREKKGKGEYIPLNSPHDDETHYWNAQKHRRFMVNVHSKFMIVDDQFILIGSANVNQRSMDGERDIEIVIGCYQYSQDYEDEDEDNNNNHKIMNLGEIHEYRMSLWYEHIIGNNNKIFSANIDLFLEPQSLECVKMIRSIGDKMWEIYSNDEEILDMEGVHLVSYPLRVTQEGYVKDLKNRVYFPDTKSLVKGNRSKMLPPMFTT